MKSFASNCIAWMVAFTRQKCDIYCCCCRFCCCCFFCAFACFFFHAHLTVSLINRWWGTNCRKYVSGTVALHRCCVKACRLNVVHVHTTATWLFSSCPHSHVHDAYHCFLRFTVLYSLDCGVDAIVGGGVLGIWLQYVSTRHAQI